MAKKTAIGKTVGAFSSIPVDMQRSAAFRSLAASGIRVLLWCMWKNYGAATNKSRAGKPSFRLTNAEARDQLGLSTQTFSNAKAELQEKGFICCTVQGGLKGCNGIPSEFELVSDWKNWKPPAKSSRKMEAARAALKEKKEVVKLAV